MHLVEAFDTIPAFEVLTPPDVLSGFVFNSPHSGAVYPTAFLRASRLDERAIRRSEDAFVDELFIGCLGAGAPLMRAHFPRAFLDVNREPYELDPKMFDGRLPSYANVRSLRVAGGLGTIARIVSEQEEIYAERLSVAEGLERIETFYKPYHATLRKLLARTHVTHGYAVLIDCHSMPSVVRGQDMRHRPDIVLGDRYGTSCHPDVVETAGRILRDLGFAVARNKPYAGGFITEHYGKPGKQLHALQVEVNRALYMDEKAHEKTSGFAHLQGAFAEFSRRLVATGLVRAQSAQAAE
jgi:N-formylglutamate amidohydrolase